MYAYNNFDTVNPFFLVHMQVGVLEVVSEDTSKHHELSEKAEFQEPIT